MPISNTVKKSPVIIDGASFEAMEKKLLEIVQSRPEEERWADFLEFSSNVVLMDLIASGMSYNNYESKIALREAFLHISTRLSSKIGVAETLGYSVNRGQNKRLKLTVEPSVTISLPALSVIGICNEAELVNVEPVVLNSGQVITFDAVVGRLFEEEQIYYTDQLTRLRFLTEGASEDLKLYLNGTEIEYTEEILEMVDGKFCLLTNHLQSVDLFYLNLTDPKISLGDVAKIRFIKRENLFYALTDVKFDYGIIREIMEGSKDQEIETLTQIEYNAPLYHEVQKVIRGRRDYHKYLPSLDSSIIDSNYMDISPAVVAVTYLRDDESYFSREEKDELLQGLMARRPFGVEPPKDLIDPIGENLQLNVELTLMSYDTPLTVTADVDRLLAGYNMILGTSINFKDAEKTLEYILDYVKIARITVNAPTWEDTPYLGRSWVTPTDADNPNLYYQSRLTYNSGASEPTWPTVPGDQVVDGGLIWEAYLAFKPAPDWEANKEYKYLDTVKKVGSGTTMDIYYECVGFVNKTGTVVPSWPVQVGTLVYDNQVVWEIRDAVEGETYGTWSADTNLQVGFQVSVLPNLLKAVVLSFCGKGSGTEPTWPEVVGDVVLDGNIEWKTCLLEETLSPLGWNQYYRLTNKVTLVF